MHFNHLDREIMNEKCMKRVKVISSSHRASPFFKVKCTSIQITLEPRHPTAMPECCFLCSRSCDSLQVLALPYRSLWTPDTLQSFQSVFTFMRLFAGPGTSIQITVDPRHPTAMPEFRFLGADQGLLLHCSYALIV